jgi:methylmalonyl-CoA mutase cobalamin-binding subunit
MADLIPKDLPKGKETLEEGRKIGRELELGVGAFCREKNVKSIAEYRMKRAQQGEITWHMIIGLPTLEDQIDAIKDIYKWGQETGVHIDIGQICPDTRMALPPEMWDKAPRGSSFMLNGLEDYVRLAQAAPIQLGIADSHIGSPASVRNTVNALKAGAGYIGSMSQFVYTYPYFRDDVSQVSEVIKALGIMSAKRKDNILVHSYTGSGMPGLFMDNVTIIGYHRFEKYIVDELCGARYATGFGGLHSNIPTKIATWLALWDVLRVDHPPVTFVYGNTIDVTEHAGSNYAITTAELVPQIAAERYFKTATSMLCIPAKEKVRVPTKNEIKDIFMAGAIARWKAEEYEKFMDYTYINKVRAELVQKGLQFFENMKKGLPDMGVDIKDPLQVTLALRRLGAARIEELFHPGKKDPTMPNGVGAFVPTELMTMSVSARDVSLKKIREKGLGDAVKGKAVVVGSTDWHAFALFVLTSVFEQLGAKVVNAGVDKDPEEMLDLAAENQTPYLVITSHNGLCLDYSTKLVEQSKRRDQKVKIFMGGRLNAVLPGYTEAIDVSDRIAKLGVVPSNDITEMISIMAKN